MGTCAVGVVWSLVSVYLLGQVDPKFGPGGTVQLAGLIAFSGGLVGAVGASPAYSLLFRRCASVRPLVPLLAGAVSGVCLAPLLYLALQFDPASPLTIPALVGTLMLLGFVTNGLLGGVVMRTACCRGIHHCSDGNRERQGNMHG